MLKLKSTVLTKAEQWAYEDEWRVLDPAGSGTRCFPSGSLVEVITGCRTSDEDRSLLLKYVEASEETPSLYKAVQDDRTYSLNLEAADPS